MCKIKLQVWKGHAPAVSSQFYLPWNGWGPCYDESKHAAAQSILLKDSSCLAISNFLNTHFFLFYHNLFTIMESNWFALAWPSISPVARLPQWHLTKEYLLFVTCPLLITAYCTVLPTILLFSLSDSSLELWNHCVLGLLSPPPPNTHIFSYNP